MSQTDEKPVVQNERLDGRVALVTGAGKGIGLACARELAARGATVVVSDLDGSSASAAADGIENASAATLDVTDHDAVAAHVADVVSSHGRLDIAVANAGIGFVKPLVEMSFAEWRQVLSVNLDGVFSTLTEAGRHMAGAGGGALVTVGSITALTGSPGIGHYAAAKAGAVSITKTINAELRAYGVRANAVLPGFIKTELVTDSESDFDALLPGDMTLEQVVTTKQNRWGTPEDVAKVVAFLASDRASWIGGAGYVLDGGWRASAL